MGTTALDGRKTEEMWLITKRIEYVSMPPWVYEEKTAQSYLCPDKSRSSEKKIRGENNVHSHVGWRKFDFFKASAFSSRFFEPLEIARRDMRKEKGNKLDFLCDPREMATPIHSHDDNNRKRVGNNSGESLHNFTFNAEKVKLPRLQKKQAG